MAKSIILTSLWDPHNPAFQRFSVDHFLFAGILSAGSAPAKMDDSPFDLLLHATRVPLLAPSDALALNVGHPAIAPDVRKPSSELRPWPRKTRILAGALAVLAGLSIVLYYVVAPLVVENVLKESSIVFSYVGLSQPNDADFLLTASVSLDGAPSWATGSLRAMPVKLLYGSNVVGSLTLPSLGVSAGRMASTPISARVDVTSIATFNAFASALLDSVAGVSLAVRGDAVFVIGASGAAGLALPAVPFVMNARLPGCGGLNQTRINAMSLVGSNATAVNVELSVSVLNPAPIAINPLGDIGAAVFFDGGRIGTVTARNVSLGASRWTNVTFTGTLGGNVSALSAVISAGLDSRPVTLSVNGFALPSSEPLFAGALSQLVLSASLPPPTEPILGGQSISALSLTPADESTLLNVDLTAAVSVNSPLGPNSPFRILSVALTTALLGNGVLLGNLSVPLALQRSSSKDEQLSPTCANVFIRLSGSLDIYQPAEFAAFIDSFVSSPSVTIGLINGQPNAATVIVQCALGTLTLSMPLAVSTRVHAMGGSGAAIAAGALQFTGETAPPSPPGITGLSTLSLSNPSLASVSLGVEATFGLWIGSHRIGAAHAFNASIAPGTNTLALNVTICPQPSALSALGDFVALCLSGANCSAMAVGESIDLGQGRLTPPWLQGVLHNMSMTAALPGLGGSRVLTNLSAHELSIDFPSLAPALSESISPPVIAGALGAILQMPVGLVGLPVRILGVNLSLALSRAASLPFASFSAVGLQVTMVRCGESVACQAPSSSVAQIGDPLQVAPIGVLSVFLPPTSLEVSDSSAFGEFMADILGRGAVELRVSGTASALVDLPFGIVPIAGLPLDAVLTVPGMSGFVDPPPRIEGLSILNTTADSVTVRVSVALTNPTAFGGSFGPVALAMVYDGVQIATAAFDDLIIGPGVNNITTSATVVVPPSGIDPAGAAAVSALVSRFLLNEESNVTLNGVPGSSPWAPVNAAFASLNLSASIPGCGSDIILWGTGYPDWRVVFDKRVNITLRVHNPVASPIELVAANLTLTLCANQTSNSSCAGYAPEPMGFFFDGDLAADPIVVPASATVTTGRYAATALAGFSQVLAMMHEERKYDVALARANGTLLARLGEGSSALTVPIEWDSDGIPLLLDWRDFFGPGTGLPLP